MKKLEIDYDRVDRTDTNSSKSAIEVFANLEQEVIVKLRQFASYECVITDRYHGTIFSIIANTPVIVIKTNDHKVTSALEWFDGRYSEYSVQLADNLNDAYSYARKIKESHPIVVNDDSLYKEYYKDKLLEVVENI